MVSIMNKELIRTIKFTLFSLSAGLIEIGVFELLYDVLHFKYWPCYLVALTLSVVWNFTLNRNFTFKSAKNVPLAMFQVFCYYLVFTPVTTIFGDYLVEKLLWNGTFVTVMNMVLNFITEYLYDRFYVFKDSIDTKVK